MEHDTRDLDGVIDEVAQAMTGAELRRDLRPAIAARIAGRPSWTSGWRMGTAVAAIASIVIAVVVMRSEREPRETRPVAEAGLVRTEAPAPRVDSAPTVEQAAAVPRAPRGGVGRQRLGGVTTADVVEIDPLAIVPLEADEASGSQVVEIAPIDIEPVRVSQLESIAD